MQYKKIVEYSENNISIPALIGFPTLFLIISALDSFSIYQYLGKILKFLYAFWNILFNI